MSEKTLILIKPDGVRRGLIGQILGRIEAKGYQIQRLQLLQASDVQLAQHYAEHVEKPFYPEMAQYMQSGAIVAAVIGGAQVIAGIRQMIGATDPAKAAPGTIRGDLAQGWEEGPIQNLIHASDSAAAAEREMKIWFA